MNSVVSNEEQISMREFCRVMRELPRELREREIAHAYGVHDGYMAGLAMVGRAEDGRADSSKGRVFA